MSGKNIILDDKQINKRNFGKSKKLFNIYDIEVDKILNFKKEPYVKKTSFKYFLGYNDDVMMMIMMMMMPLDLYV